MAGGRLSRIDALRGFAVSMMIVYHFFFDLDFFGVFQIALGSTPWVMFQRLIGSLFLLLVGFSLVLSESRNKEGYLHHAKRGIILAGIALLITVATWTYPHEGFIQFGIIHLIAFSTFIGPLFFRFGRWNIIIGAIVIILGLWFGQLTTDTHALFWLGITDSGYTALDHYPVFPWFGVVLIGIALGQLTKPGWIDWKGTERNATGWFERYLVGPLAFLGSNSLVIYLIHQPIIIGLIWLLLIR